MVSLFPNILLVRETSKEYLLVIAFILIEYYTKKMKEYTNNYYNLFII